MKHPNALAAGTANGATLALVWLLHRYAHVGISVYAAGLIVGFASTVVLFIGRDGIKGALARIWRGGKAAWSGAPKAPESPKV